MTYTLELTDVADEAVRKLIVAPLIEYNTAQTGPGNGKPLVITIKDELGVPIKLIGTGEKAGDMEYFNPRTFVEALFE